MKKFLSLAAMLVAVASIYAQDPIPVTCAEAKAAMPETSNGVTNETYVVTGYITNTNEVISREQQTFWMDDEPGTKKTIQGYWCNLPEGEKDIPLKVGDKITLTGKIMNYSGTAEIKNGNVAIIERAAVVTLDTISVSDAIKRIKENNLGPCYVKGKVVEILTKDADVAKYGNINYWMVDLENANDSIEGYKMYGANNKKYSSSADVEFFAGDEILVYATALKLYNNKVYEIDGGYYFRTLKSNTSVIDLDWATGTAYRESTGWTLEIAKGNNDQNNLVNLKINSTKKDAIAGSYPLAAGSEIVLNGTKTAITAGNVKVTFKEIGVNSLNIYDVQATFTVGEKVYRIMNDVEFYAVDENSDEIALVGDRPFKPTEGQEITCAQAREYALSLASGTTGDVKVTVVGYVTDLYSNGVTFWMDDQQGSAKTFQAYMVKTVQPAGVGLKNGAKVKVTGYVTNYKGTTPELMDGAVEILSGGEEVKTIKATVAEAITAAEALANNAVTTDLYEITAFIADVAYAYSADYGNISLWLTDTEGSSEQVFQAYRAKCDASIAEQLVAGAKVVITGNLKKQYDAEKTEEDGTVKPERTILEIVNGKVVLYGTGVDNINTDVQAVKFIENGQIYILRNGVRYNLQGQVAE
ncbi:MAG: hypothetical protein IKO63_05740 [Paludibacteraceae bacterium]|nr:hypothetical protein [Paludibacteraceae bacterium]